MPKRGDDLIKIIIPTNHTNPPEAHEIEVATILAEYYHVVVEFLIPIDDYKRKTPDIVMQGIEWEIKSPIGKSKHTVGYQFSRASKQSHYIIFDARRTPIEDEFIEKKIRFELSQRRSIKKVIFMLLLKGKSMIVL